MKGDSPPPSPSYVPPPPPMTLHPHTDTITPTTTPSTPTSEGSLSDFRLSQIHDSRDPSSDDSRDLQGIAYDSSYGLPYDVPTRPLGFHSDDETHLDLTDRDDADDIMDEGSFLSLPTMDKISGNAIEIASTTVGPSTPPYAASGGAVPLELVVARHEMSGRQSVAQAPPPPSLSSQREGETTSGSQAGNFTTVGSSGSPALARPSCADFVRRLNFDGEKLSESSQWEKDAKETAVALNDSKGNSHPNTRSGRPLPFLDLSVNRPHLIRYKRFDDDEDFTDHQATSRESPCTTDFRSEVISCQIGPENIDQGTSKGSDLPIRSKRYRKKPIGLTLAIGLNENDSDAKRETALIKPNERLPRRQSFVVLSLEDNDTSQGDSWDHSELEDDALESMKIEDKWKMKDISRCPITQPYRMESDSDMAVVNITEGEDDSKQKYPEKSDYESDRASYDNIHNLEKGSRVKRVLCDVSEDSHDGKDVRKKKASKDSGMIDEGHENPAYLDDEQDAVSQDENGQDRTPVEVSRRRSNPEIWPAGHRPEDIVRSHSCGNELNEVMNNLSGDQEEPVVVIPPTLRKRSTSRGRQENIDGKEGSILVENSSATPKKEKVIVSFGPTFAYGAEDTVTASIFQKLVGSSHSKLTRSESSKSNLVGSKREEVFTRSTSNIWEGGSRTKGSGHGRPPQAPSSQKSIRLQQHLYRNSRRNMQQKLLRQLSDVYYDDHRYNNSDHYGNRHDHSHHHHSRHNRDTSPSTPTDHRGHGHHSHGHGHHHRSQSQKYNHKPKHEPLRRLNTYGHEDYHKYVQEHEHRYELARSHELLLVQSQQGYGYGGQGGVGGLKPPIEGGAVRRISHYQQEEKGKTDVERWVGVHGDQPSEGAPSQPLLPTPGTPHIVVSPEDSNDRNPTDADNGNCLGAPGPNGPVFPNAQSTPAPPPTPANNTEENRSSRPDKLALNMTTLSLPDGRHPSLDGTFFKKTRRGSISEMHQRFGSQTNLQRSNSTSNIQRSNSRNSLAPSVLDWKQEGNDSLIACLSALYGKLLVVMGMAFPTAEVISHDIPITFYNGFYLYLYCGSIIFLVYAYLFLLHSINIPTETLKSKFHSIRSLMTIPDLSMVLPNRISSKQEGNLASKESRQSGCTDIDKESDRASVNTGSFRTPKYTLTDSNNHGSMYLKMGAVLFGIGSMIYSGLEVGQYFELKSDENCADILLAISPAARMLFTFIQMYFIFLNSRVAISRHRIIARFGLMHMIGTNLCIWLNVLVQETKHEIINLTLGPGVHHGGDFDSHVEHGASEHGAVDHGAVDHGTSGSGHHGDASAILGHDSHDYGHVVDNYTDHALLNDSIQDHHTPDPHDIHQAVNTSHHITRRAANHQALSIYECRRSDLMGELVDEASPFLFPCTIEYSLLCAGVLYVIWKNINKPEVTCDGDSDISTYIARKARHHYSVDCAHANRGLFMGILVLVLTIISLILFFVLINNEAYKEVAILEANIIELSVYGVASVTVIIGMIQMRELEFIPEGDIELDNILLLIAQSGVYIYTSFTVIGGHFTMTDNLILPLLSSIITLLQTTLQTIFVLDASRRCCYNQDQLQRKPGREMVTFLLVCNLAMWAINTFETSRADAHPTQLNFYGIWAWTIISHISMPLAIFYRFHVTVCLCEIWKRSYKLRNDY